MGMVLYREVGTPTNVIFLLSSDLRSSVIWTLQSLCE